jgi:hypothetical protein
LICGTTALSRLKQGFDSPWERQSFQWLAVTGFFRYLAGKRRVSSWRKLGFNGTINGRLNYMPVTYHGNGTYRSTTDGTEVRVKPLPRDIFKEFTNSGAALFA